MSPCVSLITNGQLSSDVAMAANSISIGPCHVALTASVSNEVVIANVANMNGEDGEVLML